MKIPEFLQALVDSGIKPAFDNSKEYKKWNEEFIKNSEKELERLEHQRRKSLYHDEF